MGKWENGKMGRWEDEKMGRWVCVGVDCIHPLVINVDSN